MPKFILPNGTKAPDAELIDGIDSTSLVQTAFASIKAVNNSGVNLGQLDANAKADLLILKEGTGISLIVDSGSDTITINNTYSYVHPSTHGASMIVEDSTHRFVTDTEKSTWNAKLGSIPVATSGALGGIKSGTDISINASGNVSVLNSSKINNCSINDSGTTTTDLWTASKTNTMLNGKVNTTGDNMTFLTIGNRFKLEYNSVNDSLEFKLI